MAFCSVPNSRTTQVNIHMSPERKKSQPFVTEPVGLKCLSSADLEMTVPSLLPSDVVLLLKTEG